MLSSYGWLQDNGVLCRSGPDGDWGTEYAQMSSIMYENETASSYIEKIKIDREIDRLITLDILTPINAV